MADKNDVERSKVTCIDGHLAVKQRTSHAGLNSTKPANSCFTSCLDVFSVDSSVIYTAQFVDYEVSDYQTSRPMYDRFF